MQIINKSKLSNEQLEEFLKKQDFKFGYFDMYHNGGATGCFALDEFVVVLMHESNWSDARGGGGIERKSGVYLFNGNLEKLSDNWLKEYRDRSSSNRDDYSRHLTEIVDVVCGDQIVVKCKTGTGGTRQIILSKEKSK
jgi:hypothetical protein